MRNISINELSDILLAKFSGKEASYNAFIIAREIERVLRERVEPGDGIDADSIIAYSYKGFDITVQYKKYVIGEVKAHRKTIGKGWSKSYVFKSFSGEWFFPDTVARMLEINGLVAAADEKTAFEDRIAVALYRELMTVLECDPWKARGILEQAVKRYHTLESKLDEICKELKIEKDVIV